MQKLQFGRIQKTLYTDRACLQEVYLLLVDSTGALLVNHHPSMQVRFTVHRADDLQILQDVLGERGMPRSFECVTKALVGGCISLDWMKFFKVSSKLGRRFVLKAAVVAGSDFLFSWSNAFVVKTSRVLGTKSVHLQAQTPVSKIPDIGNVTAARLANFYIFTALHLAQCYEDTNGLMIDIHKTRGKLTKPKFQLLGKLVFDHLKNIGEFASRSSTGVPTLANDHSAESELLALGEVFTQSGCDTQLEACHSGQDDVTEFLNFDHEHSQHQVAEHMLVLPIPNAMVHCFVGGGHGDQSEPVGDFDHVCASQASQTPTTVHTNNWQTQHEPQQVDDVTRTLMLVEVAHLKSIPCEAQSQLDEKHQSEIDSFDLPDLDPRTNCAI
eukprot:c9534_g1_i1.p1 GENE.c9534_g1_i1~~c9534_g1_i1.p1  ORF type:complete len:383 (+),score=90.90 c9534_g1_i1:265-1413(+)